MTKNVMMVDGAIWSGFLPTVMKGTITKGCKKTQISYPNAYIDFKTFRIVSAVEAVVIGAKELDKQLNAAVEDELLVLGMSMGSQVACKWLRDYGPTSSIDPKRLSFLLLANPENKFNGVSVIRPPWFGVDIPDNSGGTGIVGAPDDTPYKVIDFVRQYDGMADVPNRPVKEAINNSKNGLAIVHSAYTDVTLEDEKNVSLVKGNITYTWSRTDLLPCLWTIGWLGDYARKQDAKLRPIIEAAYDRKRPM